MGARIALAACLSFGPVAAQAQSAPPAPMIPVTLMGPALEVSDLDRSLRFYTQGLGLHETQRLEPPSATEVVLAMPGATMQPVIMLYRPKGQAAPHPIGGSRILMQTGDADGLAARLRAAGAEPTAVRTAVQYGVKVFFVRDPDGHPFEITQPLAQEKKP